MIKTYNLKYVCHYSWYISNSKQLSHSMSVAKIPNSQDTDWLLGK